MIGLVAVCPVHGPFSLSSIFGGSGTITMINSRSSCPRCGRASPIPNGSYDFIGNIVRAFRAPGVTQSEILALRDIAQATKDGKLSGAEAAEQAAELNSLFATLLEWANGNAAALGLLIGIITLLISIYSIHDSDMSSDQAHSDAQQQIQATQSETQVLQKIYEALQQQHAPAPSPATTTQPKQMKPRPAGVQTPGAGAPPNRKERRSAAARARRKRSP